MRVQLNERAFFQLEELMRRAGHTNHQHCLQVLITTTTNNIRRSDEKKKLQTPDTPI
ncbi:hypothetical protein AB4P97_06630 [Pseudomonas sp. A1230]|uniref:hypothetical protein n=1 Tax=Pseudomonas TaxID=286 RepID=UPI00058A770B|nr:hypothetical protein [Pseudomonas fluorescens]CEL29919.1 hypothetical protein SRM1_03273 [Pseudomonas fluorescens]